MWITFFSNHTSYLQNKLKAKKYEQLRSQGGGFLDQRKPPEGIPKGSRGFQAVPIKSVIVPETILSYISVFQENLYLKAFLYK